MTDIVVTWPKSRTLDSYLEELERAVDLGLEINFRVSSFPKQKVDRCFVVHDGAVRGWNRILRLEWIADKKVSRVRNDSWAGFWPAGYYIVRDPEWHSIEPVPMKGFQGWRYYGDSAS